MKEYDRIIIGAGASGLMCAATSPSSIKGLLIDKSPMTGMKLLLSGSGQCNITHSGDIKDFLDHYGNNGKKIRSILYKASNHHMQAFISSLGVPLMTRSDGKVFPKSLKASDVRNVLEKRAEENGYDFLMNKTITDIVFNDNKFIVKSFDESYISHKLILACGGKSYPKTGSDGSIYPLLEKAGFNISEPKPALCPVYVHGYKYKELSGISFKNAEVSLLKNKKIICTNKDDLLITRKNFSGPAIINISRYVEAGMSLVINYTGLAPREAESVIKKSFQSSKKEAKRFLTELFRLSLSFTDVILRECVIDSSKKASSLTGEEIEKISKALCEHIYEISGRGSFGEAMVTQGGVNLDEINLKTMESVRYKGLYMIGEMLDIDGDTGGYNLQFAYSSAIAANKDME